MKADQDLKRQQDLFGKGAISPQDRDTAIQNAATTKADVQTDKAAIQQAELNLNYTKIFAPEDGRVTNKAVEPGNYVQVGQTIFALVTPERWTTANFKETQLRNMRPGQPAQVTVDAYPDHPLRGHVDSIQAGSGARFSLLPPENATGNYVKVVQRVPVKIVLDEQPDVQRALGPGMSVVPTVTVSDGAGVLLTVVSIGIALATRCNCWGGAVDRPGSEGIIMSADAAAPLPNEWKPSVNPWLIAVSIMLATFMEVLDTSVANVSLPYIAGNLSASTDEATWVLTSYLVSNAIILPATNWLGQVFGRKRFLISCIILFTSGVGIVRHRREPRILDHGARPARRGRRRVATDLASSPDGKFSAAETRNGHGRFYHGHSGRANSGADNRRLANLQLLMALGLLY